MPAIDVINIIDSLSLKDIAEIYGSDHKDVLNDPKIKPIYSKLCLEYADVCKAIKDQALKDQPLTELDALIAHFNREAALTHKQDHAANAEEYEKYLITLIAKMSLLCQILRNYLDAGEVNAYLTTLHYSITTSYAEKIKDLIGKAEKLEADEIAAVKAKSAPSANVTDSVLIRPNPAGGAIETKNDNNKKQNSESFFKRHGGKLALAGAALLVVGFVVASVLSGGVIAAVGVGGLGLLGITLAPAIVTPVAMVVGAVVAAITGAIVGSIVAGAVSGFKNLFKKFNNDKKVKSGVARPDRVVANPNDDNDRHLPPSSTNIINRATQASAQAEQVLRAKAYERFVAYNELEGPRGKMVKAVEGAVISDAIVRDNDLMGVILKKHGLIPSSNKDGQLVLAKVVEGVIISEEIANNLEFMHVVYKKNQLTPSHTVDGVTVLATDRNANAPWCSDNTVKARKQSARPDSVEQSDSAASSLRAPR